MKLKEVTICAIDCITSELAVKALEKSLSQIEFGEALLILDSSFTGNFNHIKVNEINSIKIYNEFILKDLNQVIRTDYLLLSSGIAP
jgi:hypothetical protein